MNLTDLRQLIREARWFSRLGRAPLRDGFVVVENIDSWDNYISASTSCEFGLAHDAAALEAEPFNELSWLPTTIRDPDPIHRQSLLEVAAELNIAGEFKAARTEIHKSALESLQDVPDHPLLKVGASDLNLAARGAAVFACRLAASEIIVPSQRCVIGLGELSTRVLVLVDARV